VPAAPIKSRESPQETPTQTENILHQRRRASSSVAPANEKAAVTAGLVATSGGGVEDIEVALALSGPEAMKLFERGGKAGRSFK
jgi:hypothetical protein